VRTLAAILLAITACTDSNAPTGASCPTPAVTYADFGQAFMTSYCLVCHSTTKTGTQRQNAPRGVDFDTQSLVHRYASEIDRLSASGPDSDNSQMPPAGTPTPSAAERKKLGEYLACELDL
jgi:uncharacterized membrane protein